MHEPYDNALLTPAEMGAADRAATALGVSGVQLMEAAGRAVAGNVQGHWPRQQIVVLCGPGNNGGDGFVAARHLAEAGWSVRVALLGSVKELRGDAAHHARLWRGTVEPFSLEVLDGAGAVIDAMFGAGLASPVEGAAAEMIESVKARKLPVCAIDVPSGLDGATGEIRGTAPQAEITVTFFRKKPGHVLFPGRRLCGSTVVADIGIPSAVLEDIAPKTFENGPELWLEKYPWPQPESHKYQRGHVLVLGGDIMTGASRLTARGSMHIGAGLTTLAARSKVWPVYATSLTGIIVQPFDGLDGFKALLADERRNAIAVGPGAGVGEATREFVLAALAKRRATVIDADGLSSFADDPGELFRRVASPCVLTPHDGEFRRLFQFSGDKLTSARRAAALSNAVVLLKGPDTIVTSPDGRAIINSNAPPDLAIGGTGDVLSGFIAGLLAQGLEAFHASAAAAWLHGEAAKAIGPELVAEDLPGALRQVLRRLKSKTV